MLNERNKQTTIKFLGKPLREWFYFVLICIVPLIIVSIVIYIKHNSLLENGVVTVGEAHEIVYAGYSSRFINYTYSVNGEIVNDRVSSWNKSIIVPEGNYYVVYDTIRSDHSVMLFSIDVNSDHKFGEIVNDGTSNIKSKINIWGLE